MKKLDEEKKVTRPRRGFTVNWSTFESCLDLRVLDYLQEKHLSRPAEEDGVIKIFKSTLQGFRCFAVSLFFQVSLVPFCI